MAHTLSGVMKRNTKYICCFKATTIQTQNNPLSVCVCNKTDKTMEMRMETLAPKTQKRTATTKRMTSHLIGGIGNKKFDMSNIEHR